MAEDDGGRIYHVVRNHEEQYSIWPDGDPVPPGWDVVDFSGPKGDCLAHIDVLWTDMRPKSLRERMAQ